MCCLSMSTESNRESKPSAIRSHCNCFLKLQWRIIATWNTQYSSNPPVLCSPSIYGFPRIHKWLLHRHTLLQRETVPVQYPVYVKVMDTSVREHAFLANRILWFSCTGDSSCIKSDKAVFLCAQTVPELFTHVRITKRHIWLFVRNKTSVKTSVKRFSYFECHRLYNPGCAIFSCWVSRYLFLFFWADSFKAMKYLGMLGQTDRQQWARLEKGVIYALHGGKGHLLMSELKQDFGNIGVKEENATHKNERIQHHTKAEKCILKMCPIDHYYKYD